MEVGHFDGMKPDLMLNKNLIFDIGMHIGQDTRFYLEKGFRVVAVEANPVLAEEASNLFREYIEDGQLVIVGKGISGSESSSIPFYVNKTYTEWSSFVYDIGSRRDGCDTIFVDVITVQYLFEKFGCPYYMKIDIEGLDFEVLKSLRDIPVLPRYVSAENGHEHMIRELGKLGYKSFKFINQAPIGGRRCVLPSKEGKSIDYKFEHGASGEFGEDTPGDWLTMESVIDISNRYWDNPSRDENIDGWYDLHSRLI
jgi:FkbM family methyltransferase